MSDQAQPILPPEIEEIIFSLCAQSDLINSRNLITVAKRVYQWLIPQLYEVVIFRGDKNHGRPKFSSELLSVHGRHVRHILFWDIKPSKQTCIHDPATCLSWCPSVVDVALWYPDTEYNQQLIDQLLGLRLTHLSFNVMSFYTAATSLGVYVSFRYLTHLELIGSDITSELHEIKEYFPAMTHLAMDGNRRYSVDEILHYWGNQLEVLIWFIYKSDLLAAHKSGHYASTYPKVALMCSNRREYLRNWDESARGGPNSMWRTGEDMVKDQCRDAGL
ncbi:hypothetical protein BDN72DRAFT_965078 [Pluteus cervinus]|uniref:Uncharacterized protein n=1 Tax=Pluteus cervinus TaxID=181527 RepID=A0ACD3A790_9AGAR|nr:hypothetical protein BDN72DRAFT_965078 [Pluteus cervinus]